jgi:hypothetical protein
VRDHAQVHGSEYNKRLLVFDIVLLGGLGGNPDLEAWIPREPELSPEWWTLLGEFNNQFEELMTESFKWQNPRGGGASGRDVQRLRDAYQGSITYERRIGADVWMAMQAMLLLNMQRRTRL